MQEVVCLLCSEAESKGVEVRVVDGHVLRAADWTLQCMVTMHYSIVCTVWRFSVTDLFVINSSGMKVACAVRTVHTDRSEGPRENMDR